ncbi:hypothetical protein Tco_0269768 [Tanacetum coccineum]
MAEIGCNWARIGPSKSSQSLSIAHKWAVVLKREIHLKEVAITELRRKLELDQKQKVEIQLTVEIFENSSKSLSKLIDCQIVYKCKTGLWYNAVLHPYTGKFMPPKPDLSFSGLEEFVNEPIESLKARLLVYKKNESDYEEDIKLTVENFENSSKSLSKLIDCQIVDKCKTGLGYNVVPPPYIGNFMPPKPNLSFSGLEEFVNGPIVSEPIVKKHVVETSEAKASVETPKAGNPQMDLQDKGVIDSGAQGTYRNMS